MSIVIPTLNAADRIGTLIDALLVQSMAPQEIIVVDSQSEDDTMQIAAAKPHTRVIPIRREDFDHGGTRDMAFRVSTGDCVVFMTQDALPVDACCIERLLAPFGDERVAAVGGRQIAWPNARPFEKLVRANNYPAENRVWEQTDVRRLGVRAFLISDVLAAYRRQPYIETGGFDHPIMTNEDMLMAQKLLHAGYRLAYSGEAAVFHSHCLTLAQEYRRNELIGRTMKRYEKRFCCAQEMGEGIALAKAVLAQLLRERHIAESVCFAANCAARLAGNRMGRRRETRAIEKREEGDA